MLHTLLIFTLITVAVALVLCDLVFYGNVMI